MELKLNPFFPHDHPKEFNWWICLIWSELLLVNFVGKTRCYHFYFYFFPLEIILIFFAFCWTRFFFLFFFSFFWIYSILYFFPFPIGWLISFSLTFLLPSHSRSIFGLSIFWFYLYFFCYIIPDLSFDLFQFWLFLELPVSLSFSLSLAPPLPLVHVLQGRLFFFCVRVQILQRQNTWPPISLGP